MTDDPGLDPLLGAPRADRRAADDSGRHRSRQDDEHDDEQDDEQDGAPERPSADVILRRRLGVGAAAAALVILIAVLVTGGDDGDEAATGPAAGTIRVDAWAPYWAFDRSIPDIEQHGDLLHEVSPFVYLATGARQVGLDPAADAALVDQFIDDARAQGIAVVPSILDAMPAGGMADVVTDPASRTAHVETIVALVEDGGFDGIDIDYEQFAFADDRDSWASTRPAFVAFIAELAAALRPDGRTVTVSIPPVYDDGMTNASGYWVYDYAGLAEHVQHIRVMAYDFSGQAAGPISPLEWVQRSIEGTVEAAGSPDKIVLGIPLYGNNVPIGTEGVCPPDALIGRTAVTIRTVDDLIARRNATPEYNATNGEWSFLYPLEVTDGATSCIQTRQVNYVDSDGARARIDLAIDAGLGGVSLWALGYENDSLWQAIDPVVARPDR
jgi:spore germination protein YaaH